MKRAAAAMVCGLAVFTLIGCAMRLDPTLGPAPAMPGAVEQGTVIRDPAALERLKNNAGVTLQWIGWNQRGSAWVREEDGRVRLTASQTEPGGPGQLMLEGRVTEIGRDYFIFDGLIEMTGTPDADRRCRAERADWRFAVTQNRPYWRLREFEWCDGLTDYIDIYFPGTRP